LEEMLAGFTEDLQERIIAASADARETPPVSRAVASSLLAGLPSLDELAVEPSKHVVDVRSGYLTVHAFALESMDETQMFLGVATFPGEELDLRRRQAFVLVELDNAAHFVTLDAFERAYERISEVERSYPIEDIRVRDLLGEDEYLLGHFHGGDEPS
jgi:hypothetical protein